METDSMIRAHRWNLPFLGVVTILWGLVITSQAHAQDAATQWWTPYNGEEANGSHVLGYWKFDGTGETFLKDSSTHGHTATLRGAKPFADGKFGGCLESDAGYPIIDESHSIHVKRSATLSPRGAFTIEMWIRGKAGDAFPAKVRPVLMDSKYVPTNHTGMMLSLTHSTGDSKRQLILDLGLGDRSQKWYSFPFSVSSDEWQHLAVTYDALGTATFFINGSLLNRTSETDAGPMATAIRNLSIGDRMGSNYNGFPGFIDEVRITSGIREFRPIKFEPGLRRFVTVRMSQGATVHGELINQTKQPIKQGTVTAKLPGGKTEVISLSELPAAGRLPIELEIDTSLKPGEYQVKLELSLAGWGDQHDGYQLTSSVPVVIVPRPLPKKMPVVMWGIGGVEGVLNELPRLKEIGFTHCLGLRANFQKIWDEETSASPGTDEEIRAAHEMLNTALENDLQIVASLSPGSWLRRVAVGEPYRRIDRNGNHYGREDISGVFEKIQDFCYNTGAALGKAYGDHPAFDAALLHTEVRGESQVSFHPEEIAAYKAATGEKIPDEVVIKNGVQYQKLKDFPKDRVIPDDHPILKYYRWFWTRGDNWNELNTKLHQGLLDNISRDKFWTFYDPAARVPSIGGSGGNVDVLSHWTYSYPDPIRIGLCADELFEMARNSEFEQNIMKMTQLIWYRSQTAPINKTAAGESSPWVDQDPDAAYITIAPMHLREAFWWKLTRPIKGIMYHGWQSLVKTEYPGSYRYTNPNTRFELQRLIKEIVVPLGPTLLQVPDAETDVVFLESFTSQMFARRGTYGWNHTWAGDLYHVLMYAQLQPRVMYEESLLNGGLKGAKVLVMADCDVLTELAVKAIQEFQTQGGLVIGDGEVCPAIKLDKTISRFSRTKKAEQDRQKLIQTATELRSWLDAKYTRALESTNTDVVTRRRQFGTTDYVFAVNDHRESGEYVGGYGLVMENGLPSSTNLKLYRPEGFVYDLVAQREVTAQKKRDTLSFPIELGPCEGRVYMVTQRPIRDVTVSCPATAAHGQNFTIQVAVTDGTSPLDAVIPVEVRIVDPEGIEAEFSGYYGAANGSLTIHFDLASNDRSGVWEVQTKELASGREGKAYFRVSKD